MRLYKSVEELIGGTPLMELCNLERSEGLEARIAAKLEYLNPAGSAKDRVAKAMIEDAEAKGKLKKGSVIIEPTSGNTGIGLACVAAARGYKAIIVMPDTMSVERIMTMKAYGAEVVLTDGKKGMQGSIDKAEELAKEIPNAIIAGQFVNPAGRKGRYLCRRCRHGRNDHGCRTLPETAESGCQGRCGGACLIPAAFRGEERPARTAGHRGELCARGA